MTGKRCSLHTADADSMRRTWLEPAIFSASDAGWMIFSSLNSMNGPAMVRANGFASERLQLTLARGRCVESIIVSALSS
jgi:hypothetical protein